MAAEQALTVLVAEDGAADRLLLAQIVRRQGHQVFTAENGEQAVALFVEQRPQLVLLDALMPVMDGFEAARQIKALAGETLVPIIFLTSLNEEDALVRCLEAGGDDFMAKPYSAVILAAKIRAMGRLRRLQATVLAQRDEITRHHHHLLNEQRVAKAVFDKVAHAGCLAAPNIRYLQSPYALFNGDLLLAAFTPSGDMQVLLGDFTGHGLPAAVGAMPLAEVFYGMTAKGYGLAQTLREMNAKLKRILPVDMFCCAVMLNLSVQRGSVEVWNGGMPDGYRLSAGGEVLSTLASRHLPLGVLAPERFDDSTQVLPLAAGERLLLLSDGVLDTADDQERLFGVERLQGVLAGNRDPAHLFDEVMQALECFGGQPRDDISLCDIRMFAADERVPAPMIYAERGRPSPLDWSLGFELRGESLKQSNPVPYLVQLLQEIHPLRSRTGNLHSVLSELFSNALEHGVLGLDSRLKCDVQGFADYYRERAQRLAALADGFVRIDLKVEPHAEGGRLMIEVRDSGAGFDVQRVLSQPPSEQGLSGRGLQLVTRLGSNAQWSEGGRCARVEFVW
ncbi:fused response regulator/phosphatase [Pseudomonas sp. B21-031]|jgi:CheY-like chemotaxis protein/serine phosphatase RsbU (regulator of sigma subunit)/anti-sigma regulatory factor (Ser/Thr protein kinase)|uniref:ATP-binding SpoIIE family protein phosphatase n=1 Tax=Pseudomonas sp. B21-031 TaxID=2895482 RepID=UPI00215EE8F2|nr:fused response regulator/phosphatase [Pseudomonas sp. B21-031]UVL65492.1 fused response regulator/phosphatase [Pseudomonas sp. B21-031]